MFCSLRAISDLVRNVNDFSFRIFISMAESNESQGYTAIGPDRQQILFSAGVHNVARVPLFSAEGLDDLYNIIILFRQEGVCDI